MRAALTIHRVAPCQHICVEVLQIDCKRLTLLEHGLIALVAGRYPLVMSRNSNRLLEL